MSLSSKPEIPLKIRRAQKVNVITQCNIPSMQLHKHPHKACLIFIFYFSIYILLCFLFCILYSILHLQYIFLLLLFFFKSFLLSEMLCAEGWASGTAYTKAPHTQIQHVHTQTRGCTESSQLIQLTRIIALASCL